MKTKLVLLRYIKFGCRLVFFLLVIGGHLVFYINSFNFDLHYGSTKYSISKSVYERRGINAEKTLTNAFKVVGFMFKLVIRLFKRVTEWIIGAGLMAKA
jgi:hypothetical protein